MSVVVCFGLLHSFFPMSVVIFSATLSMFRCIRYSPALRRAVFLITGVRFKRSTTQFTFSCHYSLTDTIIKRTVVDSTVSITTLIEFLAKTTVRFMLHVIFLLVLKVTLSVLHIVVMSFLSILIFVGMVILLCTSSFLFPMSFIVFLSVIRVVFSTGR